MPARPIHQHDGMSFAGDMLADLFEMQLHGLGIGGWQDQGGTGTALRADGPEQVGILIALIGRQARPCPLARPDAHPPVLLPDAGFILEPKLNWCALRQVCYVRGQRVGKVFLKASITCGSCAGCCGRPEMWEKPSSAR